DAFHGVARFAGRDVIVIDSREFKARYILIAAGARPIPLNIPGQEYAITSDVFLELDRLPAHIVLVGGGYIAAEFSHLASRARAHVTVFQRTERMLPAFDPDLVRLAHGEVRQTRHRRAHADDRATDRQDGRWFHRARFNKWARAEGSGRCCRARRRTR